MYLAASFLAPRCFQMLAVFFGVESVTGVGLLRKIRHEVVSVSIKRLVTWVGLFFELQFHVQRLFI